MTTLDQLVSRTRQQLMGFSMSQESVSSLLADMTDVATTFQADGETIADISRGLVEIDDELVLVKKWDEASGTVTVMGGVNGRGYEATTAAAHSSGALIRSAPAFPRARIKEAINRSIEGLYPDLVVFDATNITYNAAQVEYELPAAVDQVWYVTGRWVGPEKVSAPMPNWRYNPRAYVTDFASGKSIQLFDGVVPGQNVRIVYSKAPTTLSTGASDFTTTGYPDRLHDLVVWDACKRLLPAVMAARLQQQAVEATERAPLVSAKDISAAVQTYAALYAERLERERNRQFDEIPNFATFQGS